MYKGGIKILLLFLLLFCVTIVGLIWFGVHVARQKAPAYIKEKTDEIVEESKEKAKKALIKEGKKQINTLLEEDADAQQIAEDAKKGMIEYKENLDFSQYENVVFFFTSKDCVQCNLIKKSVRNGVFKIPEGAIGVIVDNEKHADLIKKYNVTEFPLFILVDKNDLSEKRRWQPDVK